MGFRSRVSTRFTLAIGYERRRLAMLDRREEILKTLRAIPVVPRTLVGRVDDAQLRCRSQGDVQPAAGQLADQPPTDPSTAPTTSMGLAGL